MRKILKKIDLSNVDNNNFILFNLALLISFVALALGASSTSPFVPFNGIDSAVFRVVGKGLTNGYLPYVNLFDHKGFLLYLINAIGELLFPGKSGIFVIEILFLSLNLLLVYRISRLFIKILPSVLTTVFFLIFFVATIEGGNVTEEWSLLFTMLPMYLALKFFNREEHCQVQKHPVLYSWVYGLCLGIHFMIRVNNAFTVCGLLLAFVILLITQKKSRAILINAIIVFVGIACVVLPICIFYIIRGGFSEFLYGNFVFNFHYLKNGGTSVGISWGKIIIYTFSALPMFLGTVFLYKKSKLSKENFVTILCIGSISVVSVLISNMYMHYWLNYAPCFVVAVIIVFMVLAQLDKLLILGRRRNIKFRTVIFSIVVLLMIFPYIIKSMDCVKGNVYYLYHSLKDSESIQKSSLQEIVDSIPDEDKKSVWVYNVSPEIYLTTDLMPYKAARYFVLQEHLSSFDPQIKEDIESMLKNNPPKYIIVDNNGENINNQNVMEVLYRDYVKVYQNSDGLIVFHRAENIMND